MVEPGERSQDFQGTAMGQFSPTDAALAGFRFVRANLRTVLIWAAVYMVASFVAGLAMVQTAGPALTHVVEMGPHPDPAVAAASVRALAPFYAVMIPLSLAFYAVLYATFSRAVLRPGDDRYAYLRLGMDEVRQLLLLLQGLVVGLGVYIGFWVVIVIVAIGAAAALGKGLAAIALTGVVFAVGFCAMIYLWVRLSLASPLSFDRGKVDLFGSWRLTRGRFWRLFACYLIVALLAVALCLLFLIIYAAVAMVLGGDGLAAIFRPDMSSIGAYLSPARLGLIVIGAFAATLLWPVLLMPPVEIYARITEGER